jgi:hypothetical protein
MSRRAFLVRCGATFPFFMTAGLYVALIVVAAVLDRPLSGDLVRLGMAIIFLFLSLIAAKWVRDNWTR